MAEPCLNRALWDVIAVWRGGTRPRRCLSWPARPRSLARSHTSGRGDESKADRSVTVLTFATKHETSFRLLGARLRLLVPAISAPLPATDRHRLRRRLREFLSSLADNRTTERRRIRGTARRISFFLFFFRASEFYENSNHGNLSWRSGE